MNDAVEVVVGRKNAAEEGFDPAVLEEIETRGIGNEAITTKTVVEIATEIGAGIVAETAAVTGLGKGIYSLSCLVL